MSITISFPRVNVITSDIAVGSRKLAPCVALLACLVMWRSPAVAAEIGSMASQLEVRQSFAAATPQSDAAEPAAGESGSGTEAAISDSEGGDPDPSRSTLSLPYGFYNEIFGAAAGYVYGRADFPERDSLLLGTAMAGTRGSVLGFVMGRNLPMPGVERLFVDPVLSVGYFGENDVYIDGNPNFPGERSGTNESDEDIFVEGEGIDVFFRARF